MTNTPKDVVNIVLINDTGDYIVQTHVDSLWYDWTDAAERVHNLNEEFELDEWSDCHAHYYQEIVK